MISQFSLAKKVWKTASAPSSEISVRAGIFALRVGVTITCACGLSLSIRQLPHTHETERLMLSSCFADRLKVEGSNVINMDIPATNGVIQVVESIIEMAEG